MTAVVIFLNKKAKCQAFPSFNENHMHLDSHEAV